MPLGSNDPDVPPYCTDLLCPLNVLILKPIRIHSPRPPYHDMFPQSEQQSFIQLSCQCLPLKSSCQSRTFSWSSWHVKSQQLGYAAMLWEQAKHGIQHSEANGHYGVPLTEDKLDWFNEEQIGQLHELMQEATKSKTQFDVDEDTGQKR
ncbi:unnamed protein product [Ranitomeya imitator]|uniref:Succinate dehydrogenase assembly factor 3 n=1 Tax=Ranitomeya imitator TaxID=111125 RepID=A0ABN9MJI3_9NEOB|nr:unnamed protein product [Ranitomeya imitator]